MGWLSKLFGSDMSPDEIVQVIKDTGRTHDEVIEAVKESNKKVQEYSDSLKEKLDRLKKSEE